MNKRLTLIISLILTVMINSFPQSGGNALQFSALSQQYVNVPYSSFLRPANTVTLEAWINTDWQNIGQVAMAGNTEIGGYEFDVNPVLGGNAIMFEVHRNGNYGSPSILCSSLAAGWHHFAGTYDGRYAKLYVDGILTATNDAGSAFPIHYSSYDNDFIIGAEAYSASTPAGSYFTGQIDEVRVWNYVRTQSEIQQYMHQALTGSESGLLAYYMMNETAGSTTITDKTGHGLTGYVHGASFVSSTIILPVELTSFSAHPRSSSVELRWTTATEVNNRGFEVERRTADEGNTTPVYWTNAGFVDGNGTTNSSNEYSFIDISAGVGKYRYRLKQIDNDGNFSYSSEVEVQTTTEAKAFSLKQNFPNPFNPSTSISYELAAAGRVSVTIVDMLGKTVSVLVNGPQEAGAYTVRFDGSGLGSGIYLCRLEAGGMVHVNKMILVK
ncbi:MAG: LamG-like jellyroll fold domain-containing protein [Bacteroidota bacterium]